MPEKGLAKALHQLREAALGTLWRQWGALGAAVAREKSVGSIVDPEGLVLASLSLAEEERRLWDVLYWWVKVGAPLLSVQRIKNLAAGFPESTRARLGAFAHLAHREGRDFRWRSLEGASPGKTIRSRKSLGRDPQLHHPAALMLRLRVGLGVGVKADLVAFLLATGGAWAAVKGIAEGLSYTPRAIRRALDDLVAARFIQAATGTPAAYRVDAKAWAPLLEPSGKPLAWRYWSPVFDFVADLAGWTEGDGALSKTSAYVLSSRARDLVERHRIAFARNQIKIPSPGDYPGEEYVRAFEETLRRLARWLEESA